MERIDWNEMSQRGLIRRINIEILHPLGLAMTRNPDTGVSEQILISDDGIWEFPAESYTENELKHKNQAERIIELEEALNNLLNDCINFGDDQLSDVMMKEAQKALEQTN